MSVYQFTEITRIKKPTLQVQFHEHLKNKVEIYFPTCLSDTELYIFDDAFE